MMVKEITARHRIAIIAKEHSLARL